MEWFKLWVGFSTDPKWIQVPEEHQSDCVALWIASCEWTAQHETDGRIPANMSFCPHRLANARATLGEILVASGLWVATPDVDWLSICGWSKRNRTVAQLAKYRESASKGGLAKARNARLANAMPIKTKTKTKKLKEPKGSKGEVGELFEYWKIGTKRTDRVMLTAARRRLMLSALKDYGMEMCKRSVDGAMLSPFHCGDNDRQTKYLDVRHIFKSENIERFNEYVTSPPKQAKSEFETELEQRMDDAKRRGSWN